MTEATKDSDLNISADAEALLISIGVDALRQACETGRSYGLCAVKVTNEKAFLKGLVQQLKHEDEDGSTPVHHLFDQAVTQMLEDGDEGIEEEEDD
ncbi:hypothetical protein [Salinicola halophyticus]|uniref:hypothetical protein n=1 Tax=Salinicola halophyticus TaxID=1808881 RepID=UPI000DA18531|nr:hypothetical protein [Salinicola halophyticus]